MKINIYDISKWLLDNNLDTPRNTSKGNIKLQKLIFFAQLISLVKYNELLFEDNFNYKDINLKYKNNLNELLNYKANDLSLKEIDVLELTKDIYGDEDADTLIDMSNQFNFYKNNKLIVSIEELDNIRDVLDAYKIINSNEYKELDY